MFTYLIMAEQVQFLQTQRVGRKLVFNNYIYTKTNVTLLNRYWKCVRRDTEGCLATAVTLNLDEQLPPRVS